MTVYQDVARLYLIKIVMKFWLWLHRANTIQCRECGQEVQIEMLESFMDAGCLNCGGVKLKVSRA